MSENIILMSDSYKFSHPWQYPSQTTYLHSYLESRGGEENRFSHDFTKFFGLQYYIKKYLSIKITKDMVEEAKEIITEHGLPFDTDGWMKIVIKHEGMIPLRIRAVKEGKIIPRRNVLMTIESTDPELFWLVGWVETLLMKVWYPTTVATLSYNAYIIIEQFLNDTSDNLNKLPFMLHDFGYRGVSSEESAAIGGAAHLTSFKGTDNVSSLLFARKYYGTQMAGYSIPASEHSTITSWGKGSSHEKEAFQNMINNFLGNYPIVACVSDSWDYFNACQTWNELKEEIIKTNSTLVVRPDSGDAKTNILYALRQFSETFGFKINQKGYKVLNNIALIQGDGVSTDEIYDILVMMKENGFSADNIAFGMGGALLQGNSFSSVNRDTHKFAIKCSAIEVNSQLKDIFKEPVTDSKKKSKKGRLDLIKNKLGEYETIVLENNKFSIGQYHQASELVTYYDDGKVLCDFTLPSL